jgi:hypothetical protein
MANRLENIEISRDGISEYERNRKIISIPVEDIDRVSLEHGFSEERPVLVVLIGLILLVPGIGFGLLPLIKISSRLINGEQVHGNFGLLAFALPLILIGLLYITKAFKFGYYLKITAGGINRKLPFGKSVDKTDIYKFIKECGRTYKYNIDLNQ